MKIRNLLFIGLASAVLFAGCKEDEIQESPSLKVEPASLEMFSKQGGESEVQTVSLTANREWKANCEEDWIHVEPASGPASADVQTVSIYVDENAEMQRSAEVIFTIGVTEKPVTVTQAGIDVEYTPLAEVRALAKDTETQVKIDGSVFIKGVVVSNQSELDNLTSNKSIYIQDETAGLQLYFAEDVEYVRGDEVAVNVSGLKISFYGAAMQIVTETTVGEDGKTQTVGVPNNAATLLSSGNEIQAKEISMQEFISFSYEGQYVSITDPVQVVEADLGKTFVQGDSHTSIGMTDADNNKFEVRSSKYSTYGDEEVPEGSGVIKGIASRFNSTPQIIFSTSEDWKGLTQERFDVEIADPVPDNAVYYNDFDKEKAVETSGKWPYLDQFDGWKNETGSGASDVTYDFSGLSVRSNSTSDSNYSDYAGSGMNNILFGTDGHFQVGNIAVEAGNYTMSFGTERYLHGAGDNTFRPEEFHVYISDNGERWIELEYSFPNGYKNGRWDLASTTFTLPSGTSALYIYINSDLSGAHRLDDLGLAPSETAGTEIDFSKGTEIGGGEDPEPVEEMTIAEVKEASDDTPVLTSGTVMAKYARGFIITDGTENLLVFQGSNPSSMPEIGDVVTVSGTKDTYSGLAQIGGTVKFEVTSSETITYPDSYPSPAVYEGSAFDGIGNDLGDVKLIQYTGVLVKDNGYYNVTVAGANLQGGITYPATDLQKELDGMDGKTITVTGYYLGLTNQKKTVSTMVVDLTESSSAGDETFSVSPLELKFAVQGGMANITVSASEGVAWTATTDAGYLTLSMEEGTGKGVVQVICDENAGDARTAEIKVSTTADVAQKEYTVKVSQTAAGGSGLESLTVEEFLAKSEGSEYYELTGTVVNISNTHYGNFDLVDETGSVYVYGLVESEGAADGTFENLGLKEGDVVTIAGKRSSFNGDPQVGDAYYISHVPGELPGIKDVTVAEFLSSPVGVLQKYRLTGRIENIVNTTYGNFDLVDATGSVYVYGLKASETADNQSFSSLGLKEGDIVTLVGTRDEHNNDPQVGNAYYETHEAGLTFSVSPLSLNVSAEGGTTKFSVEASDNVAWTITTTDDVHLTVISGGTGSKDVTLMYRGNEGPDAKTADITVSTTADVPVKSYTIKFKQSAPGAAESAWTLVSSDSEMTSGEYVILCDFSNVSGKSGVWALSNAEGTTKGSVKASDISTIGISESSNTLDGVTDGYVWTITQSADGYVIRPKNNDGIGLGVIADNNGLRNNADNKDSVWSMVKVSDSWGWEMTTADPKGTTRYLCGYETDNWRTYTGISNCQTKNWEIRIYKLN